MDLKELEFISQYNNAFIVVLFLMLMLSVLQYSQFKREILNIYPVISLIIVICSALYIGLRTSDIGIDTSTYKESFRILSNNPLSSRGKLTDILFYAIMWIFATFSTFEVFLVFCGLVYLGGAYIGMRGLFGRMAIFSLLIFVISPNFFQFSINVMRNGFAASIFIMSFAWRDKPKKMYMVMAMSVLCHISMILPVMLYFIAGLFKKTTFPIICLLGSLLMQIAGLSIGRLFTFFMASDVAAGYIDTQMSDDSQSWVNLMVYGLSPILTAVYFIWIKRYSDRFYVRLLNTFILGTAIYIQVMNVPFALRFAYLSSFLMPVLLIYPMLRRTFWKFQNVWVVSILLCLFIYKSSKLIV